MEDARRAIEVGVDALGFIFVPSSPRYIEPEKAREITGEIPPFITTVGVFVNEGIAEIEETVDYLGLTGIQLHGDEGPDFCKKVARALPSCAVMKAFRIGEHTKVTDLSQFNERVMGFVLDSYVKNQEGGTGISFDWRILARLNIQKPFVVAGGLSPENVQSALEIAKPYGVDVNSGIEQGPGVKNHEELERFIAQVRAFDEKASEPL